MRAGEQNSPIGRRQSLVLPPGREGSPDTGRCVRTPFITFPRAGCRCALDHDSWGKLGKLRLKLASSPPVPPVRPCPRFPAAPHLIRMPHEGQCLSLPPDRRAGSAVFARPRSPRTPGRSPRPSFGLQHRPRPPGGRPFRVTLRVAGLRPENAIYQFASTAPGTYQVMDIGRYVRDFEALDARGQPVPTERVSVNQWRLRAPARVRTIRYGWPRPGTPRCEHQVYLMCGTSLGGGSRADQSPCGDRLPRRDAGRRRSISGSPTPRLEGRYVARPGPRRRVRRRQLRRAGGLSDPARPADEGPTRRSPAYRSRSTPIPRPTRSPRPSCSAP